MKMWLKGLFFAVFMSFLGFRSASADIRIQGDLKQWHRMELLVEGPLTSEEDSKNPFLDYRLNVTFRSPGGVLYVIPGHFSADGNAGETGSSKGATWRAYFAPPATGTWTYVVNFKEGSGIAVDSDLNSGSPLKGDGERGSFSVTATDKTGRDFRAEGRLIFDGKSNYLRHQGSKRAWIKAGVDSPENFLAYTGFDNTHSEGGKNFMHSYPTHEKDWRSGDPTWKGGKGKSIIGALNYIASRGVNSVYFLTMNVKGDGFDVWPWVASGKMDRYDVSKLDQWEVVFSHMDRLGIAMHVVLQEMENSNLIDGGSLGAKRKLYYRELISRFGHHQGIIWNIGEEIQNTTDQILSFGQYIKSTDAYGSTTVVHTGPKSKDKIYTPLLGKPGINGTSLQHAMSGLYDLVRNWADKSRAAGRPWLQFYDEQNPPKEGIAPDSQKPWSDVRKNVLYPVLMAGGAGVEWFFGNGYDNNDLTCENWRSRDQMYVQTSYAIDFFNKYLPYDQMTSSKTLSSGNLALFQANQIYAVYSTKVEAGVSVNLSQAGGQFQILWFNASKGGPLVTGSIRQVSGGGIQALGRPDFTGDGIVLLKR